MGGKGTDHMCLFLKNGCGDATAESFLIASSSVPRWRGWLLEFYVVYGGEDPVPGVPADVAEWLRLFICKSVVNQHSVLEFGGPTAFYPPPPPYLNISN